MIPSIPQGGAMAYTLATLREAGLDAPSPIPHGCVAVRIKYTPDQWRLVFQEAESLKSWDFYTLLINGFIVVRFVTVNRFLDRIEE